MSLHKTMKGDKIETSFLTLTTQTQMGQWKRHLFITYTILELMEANFFTM